MLISMFLIFLLPLYIYFPAGPIPISMVTVSPGYYKPFIKIKGKDSIKVKSFYLDKYSVTNQEYLEFVKNNPEWSRSKIKRIYSDKNYLQHWKGDFEIGNEIKNWPVTNVSWFAARAYSHWKNKRLPSMNEWDYVANFPSINKSVNTKEFILNWYSKPTNGILRPSGSVFQNNIGIYDMHGLIWEWVDDFNSVMSSNSQNMPATDKNTYCGGGNSLNPGNYALYMRYAYRSSLKASYCNTTLGFRCAKDIE
jgi:formylglycine-generating enzyme